MNSFLQPRVITELISVKCQHLQAPPRAPIKTNLHSHREYFKSPPQIPRLLSLAVLFTFFLNTQSESPDTFPMLTQRPRAGPGLHLTC